MATSSVIELREITKRFPGIVATDHISFDVRQGEIHALLGENGAGKSTLMKILFGIYQPDAGEIRIRGAPVVLKSPADAIRHGIGMVHQELMLIPEFTALENIILGAEPAWGAVFVDTNGARQRISELSRRYGLTVNIDARVKDLSVGERQRVEILKTLFRAADVIIFDEPTSSIGPQDKARLLKMVRALADDGRAVVPFITHKLPEVFEICDRVTVLRNGRVEGVYARADLSPEQLTRAMFGAVLGPASQRSASRRDAILTVTDVTLRGSGGKQTLNGVSFDVKRGEILGIAGVSGNGQVELGEALLGLRRADRGTIVFDGEDVTACGPAEMLARGYAHIFEDRAMNAVGDLSLRDNVALSFYSNPRFTKAGLLLDYAKIAETCAGIVEGYNVKYGHVTDEMRTLSGGNQQKLILGRILATFPMLICAHNPTKGLDLASCQFIYDRLSRYIESGNSVILVSEDLDELLGICGRIAVMYEGRMTGIRETASATKEEIGGLMTGDFPVSRGRG